MVDYQFEVTNKSGYLHVSVGGDHDTSAVTYDYLLRMMKAAREYKKDVIYLEEDFPDHPGLLDMYQNFLLLISHLEEFTVIFYDHNQSHYDRNKFLENAANDLGANYIVCRTKEEAKEKLDSLLVLQ